MLDRTAISGLTPLELAMVQFRQRMTCEFSSFTEDGLLERIIRIAKNIASSKDKCQYVRCHESPIEDQFCGLLEAVRRLENPIIQREFPDTVYTTLRFKEFMTAFEAKFHALNCTPDPIQVAERKVRALLRAAGGISEMRSAHPLIIETKWRLYDIMAMTAMSLDVSPEHPHWLDDDREYPDTYYESAIHALEDLILLQPNSKFSAALSMCISGFGIE